MRFSAEELLRAVVARCDPEALVSRAIDGPYPEKAAACLVDEHAVSARLAGRDVVGIAMGKAALAMARGAGPVARGIAVYPAHEAAAAAPRLPPGWRACPSSHPTPDARSLAAGAAVRALVEAARPTDAVLALVSGGASALVEEPIGDDRDAALAALVGEIRALAAAGAPIAALNRARIARSKLKGGKLARLSAAPVTTLVISDVVGDPLDVIGSGPTVPARPGDLAQLVAPLSAAATAAAGELRARGHRVVLHEAPLDGDVAAVAAGLAIPDDAILVAFGEPTVRLPADPGTGGRAQQLALLLARRLRGTALAALVVGTDGIDGTSHAAGALVDGATWDRIADPDGALARADATPALAAAGALVVTGPTGINHADLVLVGSLV